MKIECKSYRRAVNAVWLVACISLLYSCASIGNPSGGPRDEDAPRVVGSYPAAGSTNFKGKSVHLIFDELVNVKDAFTNVVVSPPSKSIPKVTSSGRRVFVDWSDPLEPNTTYTIDFGPSIEDVNEGNKLENYSFSFSTGEVIDTLRISGIVLDAATLEPQQGMLVGVHQASAPDSALRSLRFERATKTDDRGRFVLRGLKHEPYLLFALGDLNNDYRRDNPAELMGFYPKPITPYAEREMTADTLYNMLTGAVDSVVSRERTRFLPDNVLLSVFDEGYKPQYLVKYERPDSARLQFIFNAHSEKLPEIDITGVKGLNFPWAITEHSAHRDTVTYWLTDPALRATDTLRVALGYMRTEGGSTPTMSHTTDTLLLTKPKIKAPPQPKKMTAKQLEADSIAKEKAKYFKIEITPSGAIDVYSPLSVVTAEPVLSINESMMRLELKEDSIYTPLPLPRLMRDSSGSVRRYTLTHPWEYGKTYRLSVDSTAMTGVSGRPNSTLKHEFTIKKREDYASLTLRLSPDTIEGFVEVLNSNDSPVARARVQHGVVRFPFLAPTDYYARFVARPLPIDSVTVDSVTPVVSAAEVLEFHTGNYSERIQPDDVYYYPKILSLKRHDRSEQWDLNAVAVDMQKPDAIKKNKPVNKGKAAGAKKGNSNTEGEPAEEDDYFDVNRNPFDPKSNRNRKSGTLGAY